LLTPHPLPPSDASTPALFGRTLFGFNLAVLTFLGSLLLSFASGWAVLPRGIKLLIADYAVTISVVAVTAVSFFSARVAEGVDRISLPDEFGPTCHRLPVGVDGQIPEGGCVHQHEEGGMGAQAVRRAWFVGLPAQPLCWFLALNAAVRRRKPPRTPVTPPPPAAAPAPLTTPPPPSC
jgi:hypothetical protein